VPGNHDWKASGLKPYLSYFNLPNNERYYDFVKGPVHFFALDADPNEPDGESADSKQAQWLKGAMAASTSKFNIVYLHEPPYSSGKHGNNETTQWPFAKWGADAVLAGDDHDYERILGPKDGIPYFVNGAGAGRRDFHGHTKGSVVQFNKDFGAMQITASSRRMEFKFVQQDGTLIDDYVIHAKTASGGHHHHHHAAAATATAAVARTVVGPVAPAVFATGSAGSDTSRRNSDLFDEAA
jgi:hypothetical protein